MGSLTHSVLTTFRGAQGLLFLLGQARRLLTGPLGSLVGSGSLVRDRVRLGSDAQDSLVDAPACLRLDEYLARVLADRLAAAFLGESPERGEVDEIVGPAKSHRPSGLGTDDESPATGCADEVGCVGEELATGGGVAQAGGVANLEKDAARGGGSESAVLQVVRESGGEIEGDDVNVHRRAGVL